jgi:hypothetical protein
MKNHAKRKNEDAKILSSALPSMSNGNMLAKTTVPRAEYSFNGVKWETTSSLLGTGSFGVFITFFLVWRPNE